MKTGHSKGTFQTDLSHECAKGFEPSTPTLATAPEGPSPQPLFARPDREASVMKERFLAHDLPAHTLGRRCNSPLRASPMLPRPSPKEPGEAA
jgi:hypothetical protein